MRSSGSAHLLREAPRHVGEPDFGLEAVRKRVDLAGRLAQDLAQLGVGTLLSE